MRSRSPTPPLVTLLVAAGLTLGACRALFPYASAPHGADGTARDDGVSGPGDGAQPGDGGPPVDDGGTAVGDGGTQVRDGGTPAGDGGSPVRDRGAPNTDSTAQPGDSAQPSLDSLLPPITDGPTPTADVIVSGGTKRAFVTSTRYNGALGALTGADAKCAQAAARANLGGSWKAWLGSGTASPATRFTRGGRYIRTDGITLAASWADLVDGRLTVALDRDERGKQVTRDMLVWSNVRSDGTTEGSLDCSGWISSSSSLLGSRAQCNILGALWSGNGANQCSLQLRLFCFEQ